MLTSFYIQATVHQIFLNDHITTCHCINAAGGILHPYVLFSKNIPTTMDPATLPKDWMYGCTDSGHMTTETFFIWFRYALMMISHFVFL